MNANTTNPLRLGRRAKPTLKHRPAIWENMLGTIEAMDDSGAIRYFDYDYAAALEFAGVSADRDLRSFKGRSPRGRTQLILWVLR